MNLAKANDILKLYGVQIKKDKYSWYIASVNKTENGETLWEHLNYTGHTKDVLLEVLHNMDTIKRMGW